MKKLITGFLLFAGFNSVAQGPVKTIGNISSFKQNGQSVSITAKNAFVSITVYNANTIRVRMDKQKLKEDFSYAVITQPAKTTMQVKSDDKQIIISTDSLKAIIQKKPYAISFYTADDKLINKDEPGLTTSWVAEEVTTYKNMQEDERFIGLGEKTGNLDRRGNGYTNWNTDVYGYDVYKDPLYTTIPFYIGIHHDLNYGIFLDNTFQTDFNFGASNDRFSSFAARGGEMNYYFIYHKKLADIIGSYTLLTGRMKMPPLWSLGYQQNRYTYYPDTEVLRIAETLREKKIPADGITLDIHYMDRYQLFTWNKERFPDPVKMTNRLKELGFKTTVIVDPGIKIEPGAAAYERGLKEDIFIKYPDGKNYAGQVWPGWCYFTDFTSEKGRAFWRREVKFFSDNGVSGIWNDMNEIATWGQKMPSSVLFDFEGRKVSHLEAHNVYGALMARTSYEGAKAATNERPFILSRSGYAGMQRYTALWTGDNRSEDEHMLLGIRLLNSLGLSGMPFTGMDIGGFIGTPSAQLYARWIEVGSFFPYFRNHAAVNTKSAEPWTFGEEVTDIARNYISLRYKLMPYIYSTFYEATQNGLPVVRSLAIENTFDKNVYNPAFQNQFTFGKSIMVAPVESNKNFAKIYFPAGKWYDLYNDNTEEGGKEKIIELKLEKLPVYVRESSIIPMQTLVQSTVIMPADTLMIHVYKGTGPNTYVYYEDDGKSFENENGIFYKRNITYSGAGNKLVFEKANGQSTSRFNNIALILHGFDNLQTIKVNDATVGLQKTTNAMLYSLPKTDPLSPGFEPESGKTLTAVLKNSKDNISISF
ncbi:glycoside hydrolase family 31 protein [soil metagenome]